MDLIDAVKALPKAEQHVHLLGSIRPRTLMQAIEETGVRSPYDSIEDLEGAFEFQNFAHFISVYKQTIDLISDEKYFEPMAYELLESQKECNVRYAEISFSAPDHTLAGLDFDLMMKSINKGIRRGQRDFKIRADIRIDLVRSYGVKQAMEILDRIEARSEGIVSVDIGGSEKEYPPEPYAIVFQRAREMGLHTVAHAGEAAGPSSIWGAVKELGVERIGHGVSAAQDPALMKYLKENGITLETCPISNIRTRVVDNLKNHPIRRFFDYGISISINSDDPSFFNTDMNYEYEQVHKAIGFTLDELFQVSLNSVDSSFLPDNEKQKLAKEFHSEFEAICNALD